jgi:hypothetical protein
VGKHLQALLAFASGRAFDLGEDPLAFIRLHGVRRARQQFPLTALLQANRAGHRSFWAAMCEAISEHAENSGEGMAAALMLSDYTIEYTDLISVVVTEAYIEEEKHRSAQRTRISIAALEDLVHGVRPQLEQGLELCEHAGLRDGRTMVALVATRQSRDGEFRNGAERERSVMMRIIEDALPAPDFGRLVNIRLEDVVAIVSSDADTGRRVAASLRAHPWCRSLPALPLRVGIGLDVTEIAHLPQSHAEATRAIDIWDRTQPVAHLAEIDIGAYLCRTADATAHRLMPRWIDKLVDKKAATGGHLAGTGGGICRRGSQCQAVRQSARRARQYHLPLPQSDPPPDGHRPPRTYSGICALMTALSVSAPRVGRRV